MRFNLPATCCAESFLVEGKAHAVESKPRGKAKENTGLEFAKKLKKAVKIFIFTAFGATDVTRTHDLLITKCIKNAQEAVFGTLGRFLFQNQSVSGILYSVDSVRFFLIVGQALKIEFAPHGN